MAQQITRTVTVRIWADKKERKAGRRGYANIARQEAERRGLHVWIAA
jgi:hypothetical protein